VIARALSVWLCGLLLFGMVGLAGAAEQVHGENSTFRGYGIVMAWAILKAADEDRSEVVVRLEADPAYRFMRWDGVDPFTGVRRVITPGQPLRERLELRSLRTTFADLPRREFHFFRTAEELQGNRPALTIYFMGIPDTAPEFLAEAALQGYLEQTLATLAGGARRGP
jgi:hypothetical protein